MPADRSLHFSGQCVLSCGTITLDLERNKVLLIRWRTKNEYLLPKGRKDIGETLEQAALRETYEETGHKVHLLPLSMPTLATSPVGFSSSPPPAEEESSVVEEDTPPASAESGPERWIECTEPIAIQQRITGREKLKIIFWFAAQCDSTVAPDKNTQMANEDFETVWAPADAFHSFLSYEDDRQIVSRVVKLARDQGLFGGAETRGV